MRKIIALGAASLAAAIAQPAFGASAGDIDGVTSFDIAINGTIAQHCAIGSIQSIDFGNLERPGLRARQHVAFDCNLPFTMTVSGRNGGLANVLMPNGQGPYSGKVPYVIGIELPVRHPSAEIINKSFESRDILGGGTLSSNGGIAADDMWVNVELGPSSGEAGLLAGDYSETVTITVAPS
jgi:spore coat protein U-like protein